MRPADTARLVALAAIWGASFLFNRIAAPVLGPVVTAEVRTLIAGIALAGYFALIGYRIASRLESSARRCRSCCGRTPR